MIDNNYILTKKYQYSHHDKDGADRNYILYFLNNILIFKQKVSFDKNWDTGFDRRTLIYDEYILNNKIYQKRKLWLGCNNDEVHQSIRNVYYPLSKKRLSEFNIPENFKINILEYGKY